MKCGFITPQGGLYQWNDYVFNTVRGWGFDTIAVEVWWGMNEYEGGGYNTTKLNAMRDWVNRAKAHGFKVGIAVRVKYSPSTTTPDGWSTTWSGGKPFADYANVDLTGRARFIKFWQMLVQMFPDCFYSIWHFPYHQGGGTSDAIRARRTYHQVTAPAIIAAIKALSRNEIIYTPIYQACCVVKSGGASDWFTITNSEYMGVPLVDDEGVTYAAGHQVSWALCQGTAEWDYDTGPNSMIEWDISGVRRFRAMGKKMCTLEFAAYLYPNGVVSKSRQDYLIATLQRMKPLNMTYLYWRLSLGQPGGTGGVHDSINQYVTKDAGGNITKITPQPQILSILQNYIIPEPETPPEKRKLVIETSEGGTTNPPPGEYLF